MKQTYELNSDIRIQGKDYRVTDVRPVLVGCEPIDFIYELDAREKWRPSEDQISRLITGKLTLKQLEQDLNA